MPEEFNEYRGYYTALKHQHDHLLGRVREIQTQCDIARAHQSITGYMTALKEIKRITEEILAMEYDG